MENESLDMILESGTPSGLAAGYKPLSGVPDEMLDASGRIKPTWARFLTALEKLGPEDRAQRFGRADQYLRDAGVFYHAYGEVGGGERDWPLSYIPVLIDEAEWQVITRALTQRVELLEAIIADIYGPNRLVEEGLIPPELVAGNQEYLRPLVGTKPASGHYLHYCAFELGRGPDGDWWVLGDRTQAPSGAGFALENRVATTRALADIQAELNVHRLAAFFRNFRQALFKMTRDPSENVAIVTPGPANETYFEHAYIARYLGFMLLEGEDLAVVNNEVMVRTVAGLKPVSVLWRRMDANYMDPLELKQESEIGTPGLVDALRHQTISIVNALESGIVETRALLAFLPRICRSIRNEDLMLPSIATWWCGQDEARRHVIDNLSEMTIGSALSTRMLFEDEQVRGATLQGGERERMIQWLQSSGPTLVGQEAVQLSTTPAYINGRLEPRPMSLRVFAGRTENGWEFMNGGFARVGSSEDTTAIAMQQGGRAADVWVVSPNPVEQVSLLPSDIAFSRTTPGKLPSRAADNLYWLGRYIERAEGTFRLLRAYHSRLAEAAGRKSALVDYLHAYFEHLELDGHGAVPVALVSALEAAEYSASQIRERFSPDGWSALRDLSETIHNMAEHVQPGDDAVQAMTVLLRKTASFSGLVHENMYRFAGWRFLEMGRRLERAIQTVWIVSYLTQPDAPDGALDALLEICDSVMTHRRRYNVSTGRMTVIDLLVLDNFNPRSVLFQLTQLKTQIDLLPTGDEIRYLSKVGREIMRIHTALAVVDPEDVLQGMLGDIGNDVAGLSDLISRTYFS